MSETTVAVCTEKIRIANLLLGEVLMQLDKEGCLSREKHVSLSQDILAVIFELRKTIRSVPEKGA